MAPEYSEDRISFGDPQEVDLLQQQQRQLHLHPHQQQQQQQQHPFDNREDIGDGSGYEFSSEDELDELDEDDFDDSASSTSSTTSLNNSAAAEEIAKRGQREDEQFCEVSPLRKSRRKFKTVLFSSDAENRDHAINNPRGQGHEPGGASDHPHHHREPGGAGGTGGGGGPGGAAAGSIGKKRRRSRRREDFFPVPLEFRVPPLFDFLTMIMAFVVAVFAAYFTAAL